MRVLKRRKTGLGRGVALWLLLAGTASAEPLTLSAQMILASDERAAMDHRLEKIEYKLRRVFRFEYYRQYGEGSALMPVPSEATLDLGHGYRIEAALSPGKKKVRARIRWMKGDAAILTTAVGLQRGVPAILGGAPHEGGKLIVVLEIE